MTQFYLPVNGLLLFRNAFCCALFDCLNADDIDIKLVNEYGEFWWVYGLRTSLNVFFQNRFLN